MSFIPAGVVVWPGMGNVAVNAGYYLMAQLGMNQLAEFSPRELFDIERVEVKDGIIRTSRLPRSRLFVWPDPKKQRDIVVFIGEAQPPMGKYAFCQRLSQYARDLGVKRVITFAAMVTQMQPGEAARIFAAATTHECLEELSRFQVEVLKDGQISGLNGALLGVAAEEGLEGICLLGEVPMVFAQFPYPQGSYVVLETFSKMADLGLDLSELKQQSEKVEKKLEALYGDVKQAPESSGDESFPAGSESGEEEGLDSADRRRIEELFEQAKKDRSKAYELKEELDRLGCFAEYEDRFFDLFRKTDD